MVEDPSGQRLLKAKPNEVGKGYWTAVLFLALYYAKVASTGLFTASVIMLQLSNSKNKLFCSFLLFMAYMYKENCLVLAGTTTHRQLSHISSSSITCRLPIRSYN